MNYKILLFTAIVTMLTACSKSDDNDRPVVENIYQQLMDATAFDDVTVKNNPVFVELGYQFKVLEPGTITALIAKVPLGNEQLVINIWDHADNTIVHTETVSIGPETETEFAITPFLLEKNHEYAISIQAKDYYVNKRTSALPAFPYALGSIQIIGFGSQVANTYPEVAGLPVYFGNVGFKFLRTE